MRRHILIRPSKEEILNCIGPDWIALRDIKISLLDKYFREYQNNLRKQGRRQKKINYIRLSIRDLIYLLDELTEEGYLEKRIGTTTVLKTESNKERETYEYRRTGKLYKVKTKKRMVTLPVPACNTSTCIYAGLFYLTF